ncbi:helix-turn-helix transcriptional regulator [Virgibacillus pantothenticus]|uniref:helix-turn-helix domain-containing protein n=1 Tax=Virgibacillus pantothenticus TaxID=1473 RepID=UPI0021501B54|nr:MULTISPECIES: helix-turn-helix transcriptional regulator [Virgibacillus]MEB5453917.1 helix-turn-helix transcriptional regulator [Virgibacillus pantothenticus]MEB5462258.1 helix-turn-helix transcriptional regulator [Virgibacillus pantothenticus]MEB5466398.1 helix-turn-helix transcriptional regulator [Virgibacillus pantothenticus]MED3735428.1 helix-turn-helix transcriptional regulator [Virgibacillus pantothenticus]
MYVSRNSVSNWKRGKSYPDIEVLLRMSILFDVTIDHLVKGDLKEMKQEINLIRFNQWVIVMIISFTILALLIIPSFHYFGIYGWIILIPIGLISLYAGYRSESHKKQIMQTNNLKTFEEILNYVEGKEQGQHTDRVPDKSKIVTSIYGIVFFSFIIVSVIVFL